MTRVDSEDGKLGAAWVIGLDTPYYAITDDAGRFRIDELATGHLRGHVLAAAARLRNAGAA